MGQNWKILRWCLMAKVKSFSCSYHKPSGGNFSLKGDIQVDAEGQFYFKLEEEHIPYAQDFIDNGQRIDKENKLRIWGRNRNNLYSSNMSYLEEALKGICHKVANSGVKEELVIKYLIENHVAYYKKDDVIYPSGNDAGDGYSNRESGGKWCGADHNNLHFFAVKVYAKVVLKTTQTGSNQIDYGSPHHAQDEDLRVQNDHGEVDGQKDEYLHKLNRFLLSFSGGDRYGDDNIKNFKEMPYTEKRAKFFYELMLGMCKLADKFSVLEDETTVLKMADSGRALLMEPEKNKDKK